MKSSEVKITPKDPKSFHGKVKNLNKIMEMKDKRKCHF